jgi:sugar-specific transcriptional regulator TrmB
MKIRITAEQTRVLKELGLNEIQATLYLTSLQHGIMSVLELSKITGINRQQIYQEAEKLLELGLYEITSKKQRKYLPANPGKLAKIAQEKVKGAEDTTARLVNLIPVLEALPAMQKKNVAVKYYEGLDKIKEAYADELEASKNTEVVSFAGLIDNTFEFFPEAYWDKWNKKFIQHHSKSRMLVHLSKAAEETAKKDKEYKRETRFIEHFPLEANIDVFNDIVLIVSFEEEIAVWIESPILSQSYRLMFNTLWKQAKGFKS